MIFTIPSLPYAYHALEPFIDERTMTLHHTKHHQAYVDNLNKATVATTIAALQGEEVVVLEELVKKIAAYHTVVRNNAGGHFNHSFFWGSLKSNATQLPQPGLLEALTQTFGSFEVFKNKFTEVAMACFGSGWAWLSVAHKDGQLMITSTANQDNPLMDCLPAAAQGFPILGLDLWEHAYYLHYQNRRLDYITAFWHSVHWELIEDRFRNQQLYLVV
ncbi:superoxide dismutase [Candidatus Cardinium hertigii]|uniref:Superoxide dismutase n=1 Tax=Candidatus Cardinium hertigii TaxID=247481 RepID=A0A2Z3L7L5_9BACT|nr:superoxide dismutase [Candidatus Cardinium hertigii]AWN81451.1 Superoxide dismutase [Mn] [Candidatus Cardinium hertigii]